MSRLLGVVALVAYFYACALTGDIIGDAVFHRTDLPTTYTTQTTGSEGGPMVSSDSMSGSPAGPQFDKHELAHIYALCVANANAANAPVRRKIEKWRDANNTAANTPGAMGDPTRTAVDLC